MNFEPSYLKTLRQGLFPERIENAYRILTYCTLCPRNCGVNRVKGEKGYCGAGLLPEVSSSGPHFGEEEPLVGIHGSGTIFFTHCNLKCGFCQNFSISHLGEGRPISLESLAKTMVELQHSGCHNINYVTPSHFVPQILKALPLAAHMGLSVPLVYNTGGYDAPETLHLLDGIIDIYMPDFKFSRKDVAQEYCEAPDYPEAARIAFKEMHRQVGDLILDDRGIACRGLLVRHLVLPEGLAGTEDIMRFLSREVSGNTYINIMDQYHPCGELPPRSALNRRITHSEFSNAVEAAKKMGLHRLDKRERFRIIR
ncbi:MAG: hypothetical protein WCC06_08775 [Candidatus Aminicenantales bacterium]